MVLGHLARLLKPRSAPVDIGADTGPHRSAQVGTGSTPGSIVPHQGDHQSLAGDTDEDTDPPLIFGALRSPKEHAVQLLEFMREAGLDGHSLHVGEIHRCHRLMCENLGWIHRQWPAIGRELKRLGLRKGKVWLNGERLTVYEIGPATETASNVVPHAAVERKRA